MRRVHLIVRGTVQGVGFRYTMRQTANRLGLSGWVRNHSDGSVEAEVEGTPRDVDELLAWARQGPPGARVDVVEVTGVPGTGSTGFEVRETA
jgi:acylphosphatase